MTIGPMLACASFGVHRNEKLYSVKEVAEIIFGGKSERFVRDLVNIGALEAVNIAVDPKGRRELMVRESAIDDFLARRTMRVVVKPPVPAVRPSKTREKTTERESFSKTIEAHLKHRRS